MCRARRAARWSGRGGGRITGWIGAISGSIATAISGIVGNFQMMGMNKSLDLIEHSTRYSEIHLGYILEKLNEYIPGIKDIHSYLYEHQITRLRRVDLRGAARLARARPAVLSRRARERSALRAT